MKFYIDDKQYIDTKKPLDISIALSASSENPRAWYVEPPRMEPVRTEHYTGSVKEGGDVNFRDIYFNPHGHGTHTECLGHITKEVHSVNNVLTNFFFKAQLISILPKRITRENGEVDFVIGPEQIDLTHFDGEALIIRTLPNDGNKLHKNYSNTNPPYFDVSCVKKLLEAGVDHLLLDLPSVDREDDNGELQFHHAFWEVPKQPNFKRTITEMIFVDNSIGDGAYVLEIQMAPFQNDASPSRPVLYEIENVD
ncbi:MAG: cyclase family protein [Flavobacteriales bacterium]|nr:cyclase family protein [Flavobacteriales bacterium]